MQSSCPPRVEAFCEEVVIPAGNVCLPGQLCVPTGAKGIVLFAHGSGSSRHRTRNHFVAGVLQEAGMGTLLFDLLTREEEEAERATRELGFIIPALAGRLTCAANWLEKLPETCDKRIGFFGSSTGAAAALMAAAKPGSQVEAVVSRGGRPDLAGGALAMVKCPTLLIAGGEDDVVVYLNRDAYAQMPCDKALKIIPGATHLFEEPGALEAVARLGAGWFRKHLGRESL